VRPQNLAADEFPIIHAKIGLGRLDFVGFIDKNEYLDDWNLEEIRGSVEEQFIAADNDLLLQWEVGASQVAKVMATTCSFDGSDCYKARILPVITSVSKSQGYITGGQEIIIKGQGFNYGPVVTVIDDVECTEVSKTDYEFVCLTGTADDLSETETPKSGQNGLVRTLFTGTPGN